MRRADLGLNIQAVFVWKSKDGGGSRISVGLCKNDIVATIDIIATTDDVRQYCLCKNNNKSLDHHSHVRIGQTVVVSNPKAGNDEPTSAADSMWSVDCCLFCFLLPILCNFTTASPRMKLRAAHSCL